MFLLILLTVREQAPSVLTVSGSWKYVLLIVVSWLHDLVTEARKGIF